MRLPILSWPKKGEENLPQNAHDIPCKNQAGGLPQPVGTRSMLGSLRKLDSIRSSFVALFLFAFIFLDAKTEIKCRSVVSFSLPFSLSSSAHFRVCGLPVQPRNVGHDGHETTCLRERARARGHTTHCFAFETVLFRPFGAFGHLCQGVSFPRHTTHLFTRSSPERYACFVLDFVHTDGGSKPVPGPGKVRTPRAYGKMQLSPVARSFCSRLVL